jgi:hypothetical protein
MLIKDIDTWKGIVNQRDGYVYNDFGTQFPGDSSTWNTRDFNKLHRASCSQVKRMTYVTQEKLTKHFFFTRKEAMEWLEANRKKLGYSLCTYCNP